MAEYIDKQKLMKNFGGYDLTKCQKYGNTSQKQRDMSYDTMMMYEIADEIDCAPAADVAPVVHGRMKKSGEYTVERYQYKIVEEKCSVCEHYSIRFKHKSESNFCSRCGAKMD